MLLCLMVVWISLSPDFSHVTCFSQWIPADVKWMVALSCAVCTSLVLLWSTVRRACPESCWFQDKAENYGADPNSKPGRKPQLTCSLKPIRPANPQAYKWEKMLAAASHCVLELFVMQPCFDNCWLIHTITHLIPTASYEVGNVTIFTYKGGDHVLS